MMQLLEQRHLAESRARHALVLALELDLFERGLLAGDLVRGDVHLAEGALAQLLALQSRKSAEKYSSENWYISLMLPRLAMTKYRMEQRVAAGV